MSRRHRSINRQSTTSDVACSDVGTPIHRPIDPRALGFVKAAYGVSETLEVLSIGRTSLYAAVKRGELTLIKCGKKSLFYAVDLAAFLIKLKEETKQPN